MATAEVNNATSYRTVRRRLTSIKPSPENEDLYRSPDADPDLTALEESIRRLGLQEPLILTEDNFIVSGHRRYAALELIGQVIAPCRVLSGVRRDSMSRDEYISLLREHNRQRRKTVVEQMREELVDIDPDEAYDALRRQRSESLFGAFYNDVPPVNIEGEKHRHAISGQKADHVKYVQKVVFEDRKNYWPLSVRAVHYALLNYTFHRNIPREIPYKNNDESYQSTSDLITRMRLNGDIPWEALDDGTRPFKDFRPFSNVREFVKQEVGNLFHGYWRDLLQSQACYVEVLCEKNTVYHMVCRITDKYQIPTASGRGFNSIDPWHDLVVRYQASCKDRLVVIILADYDPEGEMIPQVGGRTLRDDFDLEEYEFDIIKAGVTRKQIEENDLPSQNFAKESSSNHDWFVKRNGGDDTVYELEALDPETMLGDLDKVIRSVIDVDAFNAEVAIEREEAVYVQQASRAAHEALKGLLDNGAQS
jgi:hypothetical protein